MRLFSEQAANGQSDSQHSHGGTKTVLAYGTFGGGTVKLQYSPDNETTWIDVPNASFTSDGMVLDLVLSPGPLRGDLSGATGPSVTLDVKDAFEAVRQF